MASLKLVQDNLSSSNESMASEPEALIFNPTTGKSPLEGEQNSSMFLSPDKVENQLSGGAEMLIVKKKS